MTVRHAVPMSSNAEGFIARQLKTRFIYKINVTLSGAPPRTNAMSRRRYRRVRSSKSEAPLSLDKPIFLHFRQCFVLVLLRNRD